MNEEIRRLLEEYGEEILESEEFQKATEEKLDDLDKRIESLENK
jgi:DNA-binding transcriptional MerR regulator